MRKYRIHYTHKIAATRCRCGHDKYNAHHNLHKRDGSLYGHGPCSFHGCDCLDYEPGESDDAARDLPLSVVVLGNERDVAAMLREAKLLGKGERLASMRRDGDRLLCFPRVGSMHCIAIEPWAEQTDGRDVAIVDVQHEVMVGHGERWPAIRYRIRWTREGRCYVNSTVNGGLCAAYVDGRWSDEPSLPTSLIVAVESARPA